MMVLWHGTDPEFPIFGKRSPMQLWSRSFLFFSRQPLESQGTEPRDSLTSPPIRLPALLLRLPHQARHNAPDAAHRLGTISRI